MSITPIPQETFRSAMKATPRPMTGFLATLTPEGRKAALEYDGPETHGDPAFAYGLHEPPMNRWAPLGIVITSFVLWGCLYRLALVLAAAMGWL